jgi:hypothetical protein
MFLLKCFRKLSDYDPGFLIPFRPFNTFERYQNTHKWGVKSGGLGINIS